MKKRTIRTCALIQAAALSLLCMSSAVSSYTDDGNEGVVDPVFIKAVEVPSDGGINDIIYVDEFGNLVEFDLIPDIQRADCSIPRYNLYDDNRVTSVKNQGMEGLCWAFAGMSSVESNLITKGLEPSDVDLSEKYMAWFANGAGPSDESDPLYGDISKELGTAAYDTGGNIYNVVSLLARGSGPVYEALVPQSTKTALSEDLRYKSLYQLENMTLYDPADITSIKNAVSENGAVYLSFCSDDLYLNSTTNGYYCSTKKKPTTVFPLWAGTILSARKTSPKHLPEMVPG